MRRSQWWSVLLGLVCTAAMAQVPTPAQLEMLKAMPAAQRDALLQQYGVDPSALGGGSAGVGVSSGSAGRVAEAAQQAAAPSPPTVSDNGLLRFGYDLFANSPSTFAPINDVPVPDDYVVGIGDVFTVQLFGAQSRTLRLQVENNGLVSFPDLGPVSVAGKRFRSVVDELQGRIEKQLIGVQASIGLADTRAIRVFVMGEATRPGSYTVSGLATMMSALYASGGIKTSGSLRNIQLKRSGKTVGTMDLYDLLLRGDTSNDHPLRSGDVILVPPVGSVVAISGAVLRPAFYELRGNQSLESLVSMAGGLKAEADEQRVSLERIDTDKRRVVYDTPLSEVRARTTILRSGDQIRVASLKPTLDQGITVNGEVFRAGVVAWRDGLRLTDVIPKLDEIKPGSDVNYVVVKRDLRPEGRLQVLSADLASALKDPSGPANLGLAPRDVVTVLGFGAERDSFMKGLTDQLVADGDKTQSPRVVQVSGRVKSPGAYPLEPGMRISDLVRAGGQLVDAAYSVKAELVRLTSQDSSRESELLEIDLTGVLNGLAEADVTLKPYDALVIKELPEWGDQEFVSLRGEVRFPGRYPIRRGETLRSVIERAGGLTTLAFPRGAVFTRRELREREEDQLANLRDRLKSDLAAVSVQASQIKEGQAAAESAMAAQGLLGQLQSTKAVGRLIIDVDRLIGGRIGSRDDIVLRDGDELVMPKIRQEVTVLGEVQNGTSLLFRSGLSRDDYINLSGGFTVRADKARAYVVRADGSVVAGRGSWFSRGNALNIEPGDTIVVPVDTERLPPLPLWQAVTSIVYNSAVALAAIRTL